MSLSIILTEMIKPFSVKIILSNGKKSQIRLTRDELLKYLTNSDNVGGISSLIRLTGLDFKSLRTDLEYFNISDDIGNSFELRRTLDKKGEGLPFEIKMEAMHKKAGGKLDITDVTDPQNKADNIKDNIINKELVTSVENFKNLI